jgi:hypothetical protein
MLRGDGVEEDYDLVARGKEGQHAGVRHIINKFIVVDEGCPWDRYESLQLRKSLPVLSPVDDVVLFALLERNLKIYKRD